MEDRDAVVDEATETKEELSAFAKEFYKDISKEDIIRRMNYFESEHVRLSNENYHLRCQKQELIDWIKSEALSINNNKLKHAILWLKHNFMGQILALTNVLRKIEQIS